MVENIFISLWVVLGTVLVTMGIMKFLKQPMIIWYILAGIIISITVPNLLEQNLAFESFSRLGISFLLFIVGMELNPIIMKDLGKTTIIAGVAQVTITSILWFFLAQILGFEEITAAYIGIWLAFSSTIVVLKLLSDRDETESTFGRVSIGILIVQDIIVMLLFLLMWVFQKIGGGNEVIVIGTLLLKMIGLGTGLYFTSKYIIPILTKKIAESQEHLFIFAIGRCFIIGSIFHLLGFGIEIGALIAGITLATSSYRFEITSKIKSLRDFFIVIFFVLLGAKIDFFSTIQFWPIIIALSLFVLIIKPLIIMVILGVMGHTKKNNFLAWTSLGQLSEFSFMLLAMGISAWTIQNTHIVSIITIVGLLTIGGSSYFITYGNTLYHYFLKYCGKYIPGNWIKIHQKDRRESSGQYSGKTHEIILFGYGRFGSNFYEKLHKKHPNILVIDEHPGIIEHLEKADIPCLYGDVGDINFLEELNVKESKMVISTIKKFDENMVLLKTVKEHNPHLITILLSNHVEEAIKLYEQGADYVILPHNIGVNHTAWMIEKYGFAIDKFMDHKHNQVHELRNKHKEMIVEALQGGK